jgi:hypothetical protein
MEDIIARDLAITKKHSELGKLGGDAMQAKLVAKYGEEGAHQIRVKMGKKGGNAMQAKLVAKYGEEGAHKHRDKQVSRLVMQRRPR